jgi:hypothetical protein
MKKEIADLWVADLRNNPPQHRGELKNLSGPGHCCLGRLCVVLSMEEETTTRYTEEEMRSWGLDSEIGIKCTLSPRVLDAAGMRVENNVGYIPSFKNKMYESLTQMNDSGHSFNLIADIIEKHWEEL